MNAACAMVMQMYAAGYNVEGRPFGAPPSPREFSPASLGMPSRLRDWLERLRTRLLGAASEPPAAKVKSPRSRL
jgi:hypothetical protein